MGPADDLESLVKTLHHLIQACGESEAGFAAAANAVDDESMRQELLRYSRQRAEFAAVLGDALRETSGSEPSGDAAVAGVLRNKWAELPERGDMVAVLSVCESADHGTVAAYTQAVSEPPSVEALVQLISSQYEAVTAAHNHLHELLAAAVSG